MHRLFLALIAVVLMEWSSAHAGPVDGEMFGYKIGDIYHLEPQKKLDDEGWLVPVNPVLPEGFQELRLQVVPSDGTIVKMEARGDFPDTKSAREFSYRLVRVLNEEFGKGALSAETVEKQKAAGVLGSLYYKRFDGYSLSHHHLIGGDYKSVYLTYFMNNMHARYRDIAKIEREHAESIKDKERRSFLEAAKDDGLLRGIK